MSFSIKAWPYQDQSKITTLQAQAEGIGKNNIDSVLLLLKKAEDLASPKTLENVQAESEWVKAKTYYALKDYGESKRYSLTAIEKATNTQNFQVLAKAYNLMGVLEKFNGDLNLAEAHYRKSLENRRMLSDSVGMSKTLQNLANIFRDQGVRDSAFIYYQRSIDIKLELKDTTSLGITITNLGVYYAEIGQYDKAIEKYNEANVFYEKTNFQEGIAKNLNNIGSCYNNTGFFKLALNFYLKSLTMYRSLDDLKLDEAHTIENVGVLYKRLSDLPLALEYFDKSLAIYESLNSEIRKASVYLHLADVYLQENSPERALEYLKLSEKIYADRGRSQDLALVHHGYGFAYKQLKDYDKAKAYYKESILRKEELKDSDDLGQTYNSLAVTNYETKEYAQALRNYQKAYDIAKELKLPTLMRKSLLGLSEVNQALGRSSKAYDYRVQYEVVKDSLNNVEKASQLAEIREIYESEKKDKQISQLELENEVVNSKSEANAALAQKEAANKLVFIILAITLFVLALIFYFYFRQRLVLTKLKVNEEKESRNKEVNQLMIQQQTKTLEAMVEGQEQERKRIAKELHDHFGSLMATVKVNLTTVAANKEVTPESEKQMNTLAKLVDQACVDIRSLSHSMHVGISETFGLVPALKDLAKSISQSGKIHVSFHSSNCSEKLDSSIEVTAYRVVQELVSNVLKHAKATKLTLQLTCLDDIINIIVEDNGRGFDADFLMKNSQGMGLKSLQERIAELHGEFEVDSRPEKGTTVIIDLPISIEQTLLKV
ncbi:sensor histidine kinase [Roseivirga sp.]|uniref:ATP-binding protein n=1 Tax=Roseivirga sp. TaxID=1964215 RepID=UPI002B274718|nr:sensor histidine kinase [Roseivirga sp.]